MELTGGDTADFSFRRDADLGRELRDVTIIFKICPELDIRPRL